MTIEGKKIKLRTITKADTDNIVAWRNNINVRKNFIYQELFTAQGHNNWIDTQVNTGKVCQFIISEKDTGKDVGSVFLRDIDYTHDKAEYGIFIGEDDARGKGYGREAAELITKYGFEDLKLHKIMLRAFANNKAALKSYENAGFIKEAYLKDDVKIKDEYRDIILMSMIKE